MDELELWEEKIKEYNNASQETEIIEADEDGWSVVLKDGIYYYKKTIVRNYFTGEIYFPVFEDSDRQKRKPKTHTNRTQKSF